MKRLWISVAVLCLVLAASLANNYALRHLTNDMADSLRQAEEAFEAGDTQQALRLTQLAHQKWERSAGYLYTVLHHTESDAVLVLFTQAQHYLEQDSPDGEYPICNATLIAQIELLYEMEQLNLKNLL
ncbi:MAG: DUF4363 family protein [Oscillospiraceae bacterium]